MIQPTTQLYLLLSVYNYDASPRGEVVRHKVRTVGEAQILAGRLKKLIGLRASDNRTGDWLAKNHHVDGFVENVAGLFQESLVRIPLQ